MQKVLEEFGATNFDVIRECFYEYGPKTGMAIADALTAYGYDATNEFIRFVHEYGIKPESWLLIAIIGLTRMRETASPMKPKLKLLRGRRPIISNFNRLRLNESPLTIFLIPKHSLNTASPRIDVMRA